MLTLTVAGFLAGAIAAATEILILAPSDRPLSASERSLRLIGAAYVAGLATLGLVLGILSIALEPATEPSSLQAAISATGIVAGALGIAFSWRGRPSAQRPEQERAVRSLVIVRYAAFQAIGVLGFVLGILAVFLG